MKYIKSLLAFATVALLGSSVWAATITKTIEVGQSFTATASKGSDSDGGRWWMPTADYFVVPGSSPSEFMSPVRAQRKDKTLSVRKADGETFFKVIGVRSSRRSW